MHLRPMLSVRDVEASLGFYRERLGFGLVEQLEADGELYWAYVKKGTAELMLSRGSGPDHGAGGAPNGGVILYVYPESLLELERLHADLERGGADVSKLEDTEYGHRVFTLRDPDGHVLSFGILIHPDRWPG